jgi:hypothetical protein
MEKSLHRKILIISLVIMFLALSGIATGLFIYQSLNLVAFSVLFGTFPLIAIVISFGFKNQERKSLRKLAKYSYVFYPVLLVAIVPVLMFLFDHTLIMITAVLILFVFTLLALMHIFLFADPGNLLSTIIFLLIIILSIFYKRYHLPLASIFISLSLFLYCLGIYIYGIRCLFLAGKNSYLKYITFLGSCFIAISFCALLFKLQRWPGGDLLRAFSNYSILIGTVVVILTLSSSGYIDWQPLHRKIFRRILLPWILIFALTIMQFLLPRITTIVWGANVERKPNSFQMYDYTIENKNGLIIN